MKSFERLNNFSWVLTGSCGHRHKKFDTVGFFPLLTRWRDMFPRYLGYRGWCYLGYRGWCLPAIESMAKKNNGIKFLRRWPQDPVRTHEKLFSRSKTVYATVYLSFAVFPNKFVLWAEALRQDWAEYGKLELPKLGNLELKLWKMHCLAWTGRDNYEEDTLQSSLQFVPKTPKVKIQRDNYEEDTLQSSLQFVPKTPKVKFQRDNYEEDTLQSSLQFVPKTPKVKFQRDNYEEDTLQSSLQFVPKTPKVKFQRDNFEEDTLLLSSLFPKLQR